MFLKHYYINLKSMLELFLIYMLNCYNSLLVFSFYHFLCFFIYGKYLLPNQ